MMQEIGTIIKQRRQQLGINQQTLADLAGVGLNTVVTVERGTANPSFSTLLSILNTLGLKLEVK